MQCSLDMRKRTKARAGQQGYILLALLLMIALMAIAMTGMVTRVSHEIRRDRELEMVHRGEQYARAIKKYFKKFGRYPGKIEDLESANHLRFLRRRYKDPITGGDWKLVRFGEVQLGQAGANLGSVTVSQNQPQGLNSDFSSGNKSETSEKNTDTSDTPKGKKDSLTGQTFGGGPIIGVASLSEAKTIREFNDKKHYNQWFFVYDPMQDRGGLLKGPYNPKAGFIGAQTMPGAGGAGGNDGGVFGGNFGRGGNPGPPGGRR